MRFKVHRLLVEAVMSLLLALHGYSGELTFTDLYDNGVVACDFQRFVVYFLTVHFYRALSDHALRFAGAGGQAGPV